MVMLFDRFNLSDDIFEVIFATKQQEIVARSLVQYFKTNGNEINKTQMSFFATQLHEGKFETELTQAPYAGKKVKLTYNKRQFYDRILTPFKSMGLVDYDMYKKTYRLSENFVKELKKIGLLWGQELRRPP